jgi:hypothetical protein
MKLYNYVGSGSLWTNVGGKKIESVQDLANWLPGQEQNGDQFIATFVIDKHGDLLLAHRRSEHVACAGGQSVLSAGEMFFSSKPELEEVSNQSAGYCPEPESWPAVARALDRVGIKHPGKFTLEINFRRCTICGELNLIKNDYWICGKCESDLPLFWNL